MAVKKTHTQIRSTGLYRYAHTACGQIIDLDKRGARERIALRGTTPTCQKCQPVQLTQPRKAVA